MLLDGEAFSALLSSFERSAWRLETQPAYTMPNEAETFARFLAGDPKPEGFNAKWEERVRTNIAAGKSMGRVRVVWEPLTDYTRSQLAWSIPGNIEAGEDIRVLDLTGRALDLPTQDFWLFDESTVVHLNFRTDGALIDRELVEGADVAKYLRWRDIALENSVPFEQYA